MSAFSAERLLAHRFAERTHRYAERDAILYALGVGLGRDPVDPVDLAFLDETRLDVLPTFGVTLASPGMWVKEPALGINWVKLVHSAQAATFHAPLPPSAEVIGTARIASVTDRGADRGAEVVVERRITDAATATQYCTVRQTLLLRGNGGFAPQPAPRPARQPLPERAPDAVVSFDISPRAALIYRLSGDWNPLHISPEVAARAGFARPILHGLCSYGIAGWMVLRVFGGAEPTRLKSLSLRFAGPVVPGDRLEFSLWKSGPRIDFTATTAGRIVLDQGLAELAP